MSISGWKNFNLHPRVGGDPLPMVFCVFQSAFQPTPPVWGATCGSGVSLGPLLISTHAPRVGGDCIPYAAPNSLSKFQPTPPVWGATPASSDTAGHWTYFNPRPPCGGRLSSLRTS